MHNHIQILTRVKTTSWNIIHNIYYKIVIIFYGRYYTSHSKWTPAIRYERLYLRGTLPCNNIFPISRTIAIPLASFDMKVFYIGVRTMECSYNSSIHHDNRMLLNATRSVQGGAGALPSPSPERKVERPHWRGFGMVGSLRCPLDGFDCINISALCVYIWMWIHLSASLGHVDAGHRSLIARRYRSSLPGRTVERPHSWSWGPDRRRSETWHRASTCPSSSTYALKYSIPVITYLSVKKQVT